MQVCVPYLCAARHMCMVVRARLCVCVQTCMGHTGVRTHKPVSMRAGESWSGGICMRSITQCDKPGETGQRSGRAAVCAVILKLVQRLRRLMSGVLSCSVLSGVEKSQAARF